MIKITTILLLILCVSFTQAAIIQITPATNLTGNPYLISSVPQAGSLPLLPYNFRWNGSATYDTVGQNATGYLDIYDANNNLRATGRPIQINVSSDNFQTIYDRIQAMLWTQYVIDAGNNQNALLYFFKATYYYDMGVCWAR